MIKIMCITELEGFVESTDPADMLRRFGRNFDNDTTAAQAAGRSELSA